MSHLQNLRFAFGRSVQAWDEDHEMGDVQQIPVPLPPSRPLQIPAPPPPSHPLRIPAPLPPSHPLQMPAPLPPSHPLQMPAPLPPSHPLQIPAPPPPSHPLQMPTPLPPSHPLQISLPLSHPLQKPIPPPPNQPPPVPTSLPLQAPAPAACTPAPFESSLVLYRPQNAPTRTQTIGKKRRTETKNSGGCSSASDSSDQRKTAKVRVVRLETEDQAKKQQEKFANLASVVAALEAELRGASARYKKIEEDIKEATARTEKAEARAATAEGQAARRIAVLEVELQKVSASKEPSGYKETPMRTPIAPQAVASGHQSREPPSSSSAPLGQVSNLESSEKTGGDSQAGTSHNIQMSVPSPSSKRFSPRRQTRQQPPCAPDSRTGSESEDEACSREPNVPEPRRFQRRKGGGGPPLQLNQTSTTSGQEEDGSPVAAVNDDIAEASGEAFLSKTLAMLNKATTALADATKDLSTVAKNANQEKRVRKAARRARVFRPAPARNVDQERTEFLARVRQQMNLLLQIEHDREILTAAARREDLRAIAAYERDQGDPTLEPNLVPLRPSWTKLHGAWNRALAYKFSQHMVARIGAPSYLTGEIKDAFLERLERLRRVIKFNEPREGEVPEATRLRIEGTTKARAKRARVNTRRSNLCNGRLDITEEDRDGDNEDEAWGKIQECVEKLTAGGMSSDDSEDDGTRTVRKMPWRSPEILQLLKAVDDDANTQGLFGAGKPGNPGKPRKRRHNAGNTRRTALPGLPVNFYNETWFASLSDRDRAELDVQPQFALPTLTPIGT